MSAHAQHSDWALDQEPSQEKDRWLKGHQLQLQVMGKHRAVLDLEQSSIVWLRNLHWFFLTGLSHWCLQSDFQINKSIWHFSCCQESCWWLYKFPRFIPYLSTFILLLCLSYPISEFSAIITDGSETVSMVFLTIPGRIYPDSASLSRENA